MQPHHIEVRAATAGIDKPGIDQHGIVSAATGRHQDIAGLQPISSSAGRLRTKAVDQSTPSGEVFIRNYGHAAAGIASPDLAAIGCPALMVAIWFSFTKNLFIVNDAVAVCRI